MFSVWYDEEKLEEGMEWAQFVILMFTLAGAFGWMKKDSQREYDRVEVNLQSIRNEIKENSRENRELISSFQTAIQAEMKDFHGRLCAIEERGRK